MLKGDNVTYFMQSLLTELKFSLKYFLISIFFCALQLTDGNYNQLTRTM